MVWTLTDRPRADLESGLGASPRGFESRILRQPYTGSDLRKRRFRSDRPGTASHQTSRRPVSIPVSASGRQLAEILPSAVQACSPPFADVRLAQPTRRESERSSALIAEACLSADHGASDRASSTVTTRPTPMTSSSTASPVGGARISEEREPLAEDASETPNNIGPSPWLNGTI